MKDIPILPIEDKEIFWLENVFIAINLYPWTSFILGTWILACLAVTFIERVKSN